MTTRTAQRKCSIWCLGAAALVLILCSKTSPLFVLNDWMDANIFFTMGKSMLSGKVLYRDVFDHKGPVLYLLYGLGWLLDHTGFTGVFVLELCAFALFLDFGLRAAALLHDITKEWSTEKQLAFCRQYGIDPGEACFAPKLFHARTAAELVRQRFPECADMALLSAIEHHTEGAPDMTLCDKLLYLADYIEDTRTFPDCVSLRSYYETELAAARTDKERLTALDRVLLRSFDLTIRCLLDEHAYLAVKTVASRNAILNALKKEGENAV